jgi:hypothetical protein
MNLYNTIDTDYRRVARRRLPDTWELQVDSTDEAVAAIRSHQENPDRSDDLTRRLALLARTDQRAGVVLLYALAPLLRSRLGRSITEEYRNDALSELAIVILHSNLDGTRLAHRLVNRAHTRVHKAARRVEQRGVVHVVEIAPVDPRRLMGNAATHVADIADVVVDRLAITDFNGAVLAAVESGDLSPSLWAAFRDHRLRRAIDPSGPTSTGVERKVASRAALRIQPLVDQYLHAA